MKITDNLRRNNTLGFLWEKSTCSFSWEKMKAIYTCIYADHLVNGNFERLTRELWCYQYIFVRNSLMEMES